MLGRTKSHGAKQIYSSDRNTKATLDRVKDKAHGTTEKRGGGAKPKIYRGGEA